MRRHDALLWLITDLGGHSVGADRTVFRDINDVSAATGWAHGFLAGYALWGGLVALTVLWLVCWLVARRRADGYRSLAAVILTGVAAVVGLGLNQVLGPVVDRPRPFVAMPHVLVLLHHSADPSFPSDHAVIAGALAGGLLVVSRRGGALAAALAVLLAFARVYCGLHYPTDVLGGLLIGALIGVLLAQPPVAALLTRPLAALSRTPLRPALTATPRPAGTTRHGLARPDDDPPARPGAPRREDRPDPVVHRPDR